MADANIPLVARIMVQHGGAGSGPTGTNDARRQSKIWNLYKNQVPKLVKTLV